MERQYERDLIELERLDATEQQKYELKKYYSGLIKEEEEQMIEDFAQSQEDDVMNAEDERMRKLGEKAEEEIRIAEHVKAQKIDIANKTSSLLISLGGKAAKIGKAIAIANIIREQIESGSKAMSSLTAANAKAVLLSPATGGMPFVGINTAQTLLGIASSAVSAKNAISQITSGSKSLGGGGGGGGASGGASAPSFNLVQGTGANQVANTIANKETPVVKAVVVSSEVTSAQSADRNKIDESSI